MSQEPQPQAVTAGDVLRFEEDDYCFGRGPLTLRVSSVGETQPLYGEPWIALSGVALRHDGTDGDARQVLVRLAAFSRRPSIPPPRNRS